MGSAPGQPQADGNSAAGGAHSWRRPWSAWVSMGMAALPSGRCGLPGGPQGRGLRQHPLQRQLRGVPSAWLLLLLQLALVARAALQAC